MVDYCPIEVQSVLAECRMTPMKHLTRTLYQLDAGAHLSLDERGHGKLLMYLSQPNPFLGGPSASRLGSQEPEAKKN